MKIAFVWDWDIVPEQAITWKDGLAAALKELINRGHDVRLITCGSSQYIFPHAYFPIYVTDNIRDTVKEFGPEVILMWGDTTRPNASICAEFGVPMALCFAGGHQDGHSAIHFNHFFVESQSYADSFIAKGRSTSIAFGTNTELFKPIPKQAKIFDALFPATFALWKRHNLFAEATRGLKACAVGYMYDTHEQECWQVCQQAGNLVLPHASADVLHHLYAASGCVVIPSRNDGGSQRTVLEALAMNVPVIVCQDSDKTTEYIRETEGRIVAPNAKEINDAIRGCNWSNTHKPTRDYILGKWSEFTYADALEKGLKSLCN